MKTTKIISLTALTLILASAGASTALAADVASYDSQGVIKYTPSNTVTKPVDPTDPTKPVDPINPIDPTIPVNPGTAGPLSIDYASSFNFGEQEITSVDKTYNAKANPTSDGTTRPNWVQVTDNRGTLAGWSLSVTATDFTKDGAAGTGTGELLKGAAITLGNGNIVSASAAPADKSVANVTLTPGTSSGTILGATAGTGAGTNLLAWGNDATKGSSVTLAVPGKTTKLAASYLSTLTWTLSDTPAN